ncbi:MAG: DUF938 domain-containing protein [Robiginitomaculum sp.]
MKPPIHLERRSHEGARFISPTAQRNSPHIAKILSEHISGAASFLEIASGTGQQGLAICQAIANLTWQPSDPDAASRASIDSWAAELGRSRIKSALNIDVTIESWWQELAGNYDHMFCANMIHIAPVSALKGLARGAGKIVPSGGMLFLYGPFLDGDKSAASNLAFDANLKQRNSSWGVRELDFVKPIFASRGLIYQKRIPMPAENHILIFKRV